MRGTPGGHAGSQMARPLPLLLLAAPLTALLCLALGCAHFVLALDRRWELASLTLTHDAVLYAKEVHRVVTSPLVHGSLAHCVLNVTALWSLGGVLERKLGSGAYARMLVQFTFLPVLLLLALMAAAKRVQRARARSAATLPLLARDTAASDAPSPLLTGSTCGFSGALFAMAVVLAHDANTASLLPAAHAEYVPFLRDPRAHPWVLLIVGKLLIPNSSAVGHACGMAVGYAHHFGLLSWMDTYWTVTLTAWLVGAAVAQHLRRRSAISVVETGGGAPT